MSIVVCFKEFFYNEGSLVRLKSLCEAIHLGDRLIPFLILFFSDLL